MEILGYLASALIGISLGLVGSGGSILTIPVLVYLFHIEPSLATAYSLFIVGTTALVGGIRYGMQQLVDFPTTRTFAIPSLLTVYFTRRFLMPYIPFLIPSFSSLGLERVSLPVCWGRVAAFSSFPPWSCLPDCR
jgi:uncharacterized membrane protein YfcA